MLPRYPWRAGWRCSKIDASAPLFAFEISCRQLHAYAAQLICIDRCGQFDARDRSIHMNVTKRQADELS
jgi:hypothetical protein